MGLFAAFNKSEKEYIQGLSIYSTHCECLLKNDFFNKHSQLEITNYIRHDIKNTQTTDEYIKMAFFNEHDEDAGFFMDEDDSTYEDELYEDELYATETIDEETEPGYVDKGTDIYWDSYNKQTQRPIQLAPQTCTCCFCVCFDNDDTYNCKQVIETMEDLKSYYKDVYENQITKRNKDDLTKKTADISEEQRIKIIVANLPTESKKARERKLMKQTNDKREAKKEAWKERMRTGTSTSFGHRRNGGGKRRKRGEADDELLRARRSLHRKDVRALKQIEEKQRQDYFEKHKTEVTTKIEESIDYIEESDDECDDECVRFEKQEKKAFTDKQFDILGVENVKDIKEREEKMKKKIIDVENKLAEQEEFEQLQLLAKKSKNVSYTTKKTKRYNKPMIPGVKEEGWEIVSKKKMTTTASTNEQQNIKTRVCKSILTGQSCLYGDKCGFAHSIGDLTPRMCRFGSRCKNIIYRQGIYSNTGKSPCPFKHDDETLHNYHVRVGLKKPTPFNPKPPSCPPPKQPTPFNPKPPTCPPPKQSVWFNPKPPTCPPPKPPTCVRPKPKTLSSHIIYATKDTFKHLFTCALKKGHTDIKIVLTDC